MNRKENCFLVILDVQFNIRGLERECIGKDICLHAQLNPEQTQIQYPGHIYGSPGTTKSKPWSQPDSDPNVKAELHDFRAKSYVICTTHLAVFGDVTKRELC